MTKIVIEKRLW